MDSMPEEAKFVFVAGAANFTGAGATTEWVNMKNYRKVTFLIQTGAWAAGTAAVTLNEAINASGSSSSSMAMADYWTNDASTSLDTLTRTTAASSTFNLDTASAIYVVEVDAKDVTDGLGFVNLAIASPGANNDFYSVTAICHNARRVSDNPPTAIA